MDSSHPKSEYRFPSNPYFSNLDFCRRFKTGEFPELGYSDYCQGGVLVKDLWFSRQCLLFPIGGDPMWPREDICKPYDRIEIVPWKGILGISPNYESDSSWIEKQELRQAIRDIPKIEMEFPMIYERLGAVFLFFEGLPPSAQSQKDTHKEKYDVLVSNLFNKDTINKSLAANPVGLHLDIFTKKKRSSCLDLDNGMKFMVDRLKGKFINDDNQVITNEMHFFNTQRVLKPIERKSEPESFWEASRTSLISLAPLAQEHSDYFVIKIEYYDEF